MSIERPTVCVIRMYLKGARQMRILGVIHRRGRIWGGASGLSGRRYGNDLIASEIEARRVIWTPGEY